MSAWREEIIGDARLILGDCREVAPTLDRVDAVLTDPPYGIGHVLGASGKGRHRHRNANKPIVADDRPFDPAEWLKWPCILWGANHYSSRLPHGRWLAWNKLGVLEPWDGFSDVEFAWQNVRKSDKIFSLLWKGICQEEKYDGGRRYHPTQKPIALMRWCIGHLPDGVTTILDPFMGSGTTGVACASLGRRFVGIECDPTYFDIACRRIEAAYKQPDMFIPSPAAPEQELLDV